MGITYEDIERGAAEYRHQQTIKSQEEARNREENTKKQAEINHLRALQLSEVARDRGIVDILTVVRDTKWHEGTVLSPVIDANHTSTRLTYQLASDKITAIEIEGDKYSARLKTKPITCDLYLELIQNYPDSESLDQTKLYAAGLLSYWNLQLKPEAVTQDNIKKMFTPTRYSTPLSILSSTIGANHYGNDRDISFSADLTESNNPLYKEIDEKLSRQEEIPAFPQDIRSFYEEVLGQFPGLQESGEYSTQQLVKRLHEIRGSWKLAKEWDRFRMSRMVGFESFLFKD